MISPREACERNARALWIPCCAFAVLGVIAFVMMMAKGTYDEWRSWAGTAFGFAASSAAYYKIRYWRNLASDQRSTPQRPDDEL